MFTRAIYPKNTFELIPGSNFINWEEAGGTSVAPVLFFVLSINNSDQAGFIDFETGEIDDVGVVKYRHFGGVTEKTKITEVTMTSPLLTMTDLYVPIAYIYASAANTEGELLSGGTKSGKQDYFLNPEINLPAILKPSGESTDDFDSIIAVNKYILKGNWHFFSRAILCNEIEVVLRPRIKDGAFIQFYTFM